MTAKTKKQKERELIQIQNTILLPLIIGFALVVAGITMVIFKAIGWVLLIWGISSGSFYLFKLYKEHKKKIDEKKKELTDILGIKTKTNWGKH